MATGKTTSLPDDFDDLMEFFRDQKRKSTRAERRRDPDWALGVLERMEEFLDTLKEGTDEGEDKTTTRNRRQSQDGDDNIFASILGQRK